MMSSSLFQPVRRHVTPTLARRCAGGGIVAVMAAGLATAAHATTVTAYDQLPATEQQALVTGAVAGLAQEHAAAAACISAYGAPSQGGAEPRLAQDFQGLLDRSRQVAPDEFEVEALLEGLIMVECKIPPE